MAQSEKPRTLAANGSGISLLEQQKKESSAAETTARKSGKPVEIVSLRTETTEVFANPNGSYREDRSLLPVRVRRNGELIPVDTALAVGKDGRVAPRAASMAMTFSGGGDGPFARMVQQDRELSLSWPGKLPKPVLSGDTATYAEVLPGVDLTVTAATNSFTHALVVKTAEAAKNPALSSVSFGVQSKGLSLKSGPDGGIQAVTPNGNATFAAPKPLMWDSAVSRPAQSGAAPAKKQARPLAQVLEGATDGSGQAPIDVRLTDRTLTLTPDRKLLADPATVFPVVIDPVWGDDAFKDAWAMAYKNTAISNSENTTYANGGAMSDYARVGYANDTQRNSKVSAISYFRVPTAKLRNKTILDSKLRIKQNYSGSWSCKSGEVLVKHLGEKLPSGITWNKQPSLGATVASSEISFGGRNCPAGSEGLVEFDITHQIAAVAKSSWASWAFALVSKSTDIDVSWRKFDPRTAVVSTDYNTRPEKPQNMQTSPLVPCTGGTIGKTDEIVLRALVKDAEDAKLKSVRFDYAKTGEPAKTVYDYDVPSGSYAEVRLKPADLKLTTGSYWWDVRSSDGTAESLPGGQCKFSLDTDAPSKAPTVVSPEYPGGNLKDGKVAGTPGHFTFDDVSPENDVVRYEWWTDQDTTLRTEPATVKGGSSKAVTFTPYASGPQFMYVRGVDAAGNQSALTTYLFYPHSKGKPDKPGDLNGDNATDLWSIDPGSGDLSFYPGKATGEFGNPSRASERTFMDAQITHRGSWNDDVSEDVVALRPGSEDPARLELWVSMNKGNGVLDDTQQGSYELLVSDQTEADGDPSENHWRNADQIVSLPSVDNDSEDFAEGTGAPVVDERDSADLLVKEGANLWLYRGAKSDPYLDNFGSPIPLGNADWQNMTLMVPGDLNKDGLPEIWARDTVSGKIHQYNSRRNPAPTDSLVYDVSVFNDASVRTTSIGSGYTGTAYPHLSSNGDFEAKYDTAGTLLPGGHPDLWSRDAQGSSVEFPGQAMSNGSVFGAPRPMVVGGTPWSTCEKFTSTSTGTHELCGPILAKFKAMGGTAKWGYPTTDTVTAPDKAGRYAQFQYPGTTTSNRAIYWSPQTGAAAIGGAIYGRWSALAREGGILGYPTSDERRTGDGVGWFATFSKAGKQSAIYYAPETGTYELVGAIYARYKEMNGTAVLGYPVMSETATDPIGGKYVNFRKRNQTATYGAIFWSPATGAWPVWGSIYTKWSALSREKGAMGYPLSSEYAVYGGVRTDFQKGYIRHNSTTGGTVEHDFDDRTAHLRTDMSGDVNGDGRTDMITAYNYESATSALYIAPGNAQGGFDPPVEAWEANKGSFDYARAKWTAGDFNGDGRTDVAAFYGYADGTVATWTFLGQTNNRFVQHTKSAILTSGWNWNHVVSLKAADVNGDKRADLSAVYNYQDNSIGLHTFLATADGSLNAPLKGWRSDTSWGSPTSKFAVGDVNGDGRSDLVCFYHYGEKVNLYTFIARADGLYEAPLKSWSAASGWNAIRTDVVLGDYDGDKRADLATIETKDTTVTTVKTLAGRADGGFDAPVEAWASQPGGWYTSAGNFLPGDTDQDGRADLVTMYNYATGATRIFTFPADPEGGFRSPRGSWYADPGTW
ncbi:hypothetical protein DEJ50_02695 [Streptomyces venezuelae]|uniref:VCBS repeat-containing protein n=1 Tax=Streptomyces venezuelae TaxID=54571 RepID=A0A5P2CY68_STRVZ|nr:FG-GAP-like repeat-containing protein [Streptomyces venezuelae]QES46917.1 hypothetical protein DEJ50_02695 [Streptomyces venezuelae]